MTELKGLDALENFLMDQLKIEVFNKWGNAFEEKSPPIGSITIIYCGMWLWIKARIMYRGATWTPSTDRVSGDPEIVHAWRDWIGVNMSVPLKVSRPEDIESWALLSTKNKRVYRDIQSPGPWGHQNGRWVEELLEDGTVTIYIAEGNFHDVSPESKVKVEHIKLQNL